MNPFHRRRALTAEPSADQATPAPRPGRGAPVPTGTPADPVTVTIQRILSLGLDGKGPYKGSVALAEAALAKANGDAERAIVALARSGLRASAAGGFVTSLGGFAVMPIAVPANVVEFYVTAARTVGAIATLRGYDVTDPGVRTAVLLTLVGSRSHELLARVGVVTGGHSASALLSKGLPASAQMLINKAIGFQLLKGLGERSLSRFGRAVPVLGGMVGGAADALMANRIAEQARQDFPAVVGEFDWGVR